MKIHHISVVIFSLLMAMTMGHASENPLKKEKHAAHHADPSTDTLLKNPYDSHPPPLPSNPGADALNKYYVTFTVIVQSASKDCYFYEAGGPFAVNFEVLKGGSLDIGLFVEDDRKHIVDKLSPTQHGSINVNVPAALVQSHYRICLDNRKASHSLKHVFFEIALDSDARRGILKALSNHMPHYEEADLEMPVDTFYNMVDNIDHSVQAILFHQHHFRNMEAVDRNIMEANFTNVNLWSTILLIVLVIVSVLQVFFIRSLFFDRGTMHKMWMTTDRTLSWFFTAVPSSATSKPVKRGA